jgi:carbon-monoxide dehydrogenase medium subunit
VKPPPFEYVAPRSLDEAVAALAEHGDEAKVMAGGQSLVPLLAFRLARPSVVVDVNRVAGLDGARLDGDTLELGALTRQRDVELLPGLRERCPMIVEAVEQIGHVAIRNRGTVGGSLAHADPAAEWTALALALDAELDVYGPGGTRTLPAREFLISYFTTALQPDEVLTRIRRACRTAAPARASSSWPGATATSRSPASAPWSRSTPTARSATRASR